MSVISKIFGRPGDKHSLVTVAQALLLNLKPGLPLAPSRLFLVIYLAILVRSSAYWKLADVAKTAAEPDTVEKSTSIRGLHRSVVQRPYVHFQQWATVGSLQWLVAAREQRRRRSLSTSAWLMPTSAAATMRSRASTL